LCVRGRGKKKEDVGKRKTEGREGRVGMKWGDERESERESEREGVIDKDIARL